MSTDKDFLQLVDDKTIVWSPTKKKLYNKGLFDEQSKKPIKKYPSKIAVISSETGSVIEDILKFGLILLLALSLIIFFDQLLLRNLR